MQALVQVEVRGQHSHHGERDPRTRLRGAANRVTLIVAFFERLTVMRGVREMVRGDGHNRLGCGGGSSGSRNASPQSRASWRACMPETVDQ